MPDSARLSNSPILHSTSVGSLAYSLAQEIGLTDRESRAIRLGALLHDLGKIGIPSTILNKPGPLDESEWKLVFNHPMIGAHILQSLKPFRSFLPLVLFHHERLDGTGYPCQLKGDEIPISSQVISIADVFHAMTEDRPYRKALSIPAVMETLRQGASKQWHRFLVDALCTLVGDKDDLSASPQHCRMEGEPNRPRTDFSPSHGVERA